MNEIMNNFLPTPKVVGSGEGRRLDLEKEVRRQLLGSEETGGVLTLAKSQFSYGGGSLSRRPNVEDEIFLVESGEFCFRIGEDERQVKEGDFVFVPRMVEHSYQCENEEGGSMVCVAIAPNGDGVGAPNATPQIVPAGEGEQLEAFGDKARVLLAGQSVGGRFCVSESWTSSMAGPPLHVHENEDEVFVIREGRYEFQIEDMKVEVGVGDVLFAPRAVPHTFRVVSDGPGRFLLIAAPGGFDDFFREAAAMFASGMVTPQGIGEMSSKYGIRYLPGVE
jgi:mannose-6-phosphate isomerase-like protein (cupin superfamily)